MARFRSERLTAGHAPDTVDCGNDVLDQWLRRSARHADAANTGRTYVWTEPADETVVAYFTLAAHLLRRAEVPRNIGHGSPDLIPAVLLARLAVDRSLRGQGLGAQLLLDALERAVDASARAAARFVVVDAIDDDAGHFYRHFGFRPCPGSHRLVRKASEIAATLIGE